MSATIARHGGRVQLEQSNMCLAFNIAKMPKSGFSCVALDEMLFLIKIPRAKVREEKKLVVVFPGRKNMKAVME
jgi:hypothetical protein